MHLQRWLRGTLTDRVGLALVDVKVFSRFILISLEFCHCRELEQSSDKVKMLVFLDTTSHFLLSTSLFILNDYFWLASDNVLHHQRVSFKA